jgi:hypothetical protein
MTILAKFPQATHKSRTIPLIQIPTLPFVCSLACGKEAWPSSYQDKLLGYPSLMNTRGVT